MQTQVVHQRKAYIPWIPMVVAALLVAATALSLQVAFRDRGTTVPAPIATVDGVSLQKAGMLEAGITGVGMAPHHGVLSPTDVQVVGGPHPRTKLGGSEGSGTSGIRDQALKATIDRLLLGRGGG